MLLRVALDHGSPRDRVARAAADGFVKARSRDEALATLLDDRDDGLAALAAYRALRIGGGGLREAVARASEVRPSLKTRIDRLFGPEPVMTEAATHG
jgi:hypothetical protein